ncbi:MAG: beta-galactosidase [Verrucomicrobiota bacterium]|nr:beta-galactosidase [Verrucomicrobiota bacterium]
MLSVLTNPDVDGITLRQGWTDLEPTEGNFDFSYLDSAVASCVANGKKILLRIATQNGKPAWVTAAVAANGGSFFTFDDNGTSTTIPVFWDPTFLAKKKAMIAALGAHFSSNPAIKVVAASFANATSEDWNVPHTQEYVTQWLALGYTSEKMLDAGKQIIDATMIAFPNQVVTMAVGGSGHINGTNLDPTSTYLARGAIDAARATWPGRMVAQKNDLSTFIPTAPGIETLYEMIWDFQPDVGGQMVYQVVNDPTYRANGGVPDDLGTILQNSIDGALSYNEKYVEVYQIDASALPTVISYAHQALTAGQPPTPTPTATPSATPSPTPSATPTATPSATPTPTATPSATPTPTATPPSQPSPPTGLRVVS